MKSKEILNLLEWSFSLYVAGMMIVYGIGKYYQFDGIGDDVSDGMKVMWTFYSFSKPFVFILGFFEILGAILLLIPKTRIIGSIVLTTILFNIILQDYFYEIPALYTAISLQILVLIILWFNRKPLVNGIKSFSLISTKINAENRILKIIAVLIMTIFIFFFVSYLIKNLNSFSY
ncbi:DoxX family protein [Kaistella yonginensis]|uniref:DoxX family protein n=1 Tax=Kaistella yonginensis TaxID=658267 RepID=UPI0025B43882|nr:DoxX family protein [Kaistella yonginensis]MDN3605725.1 DoxX family protein [Kaistella yonginensis]